MASECYYLLAVPASFLWQCWLVSSTCQTFPHTVTESQLSQPWPTLMLSHSVLPPDSGVTDWLLVPLNGCFSSPG